MKTYFFYYIINYSKIGNKNWVIFVYKDNYDLPFFTSRFKLTERSLGNALILLEKQSGLKIRDIKEVKDGYVFIGDFGILVGDITFNYSRGEYNNIKYHTGAREAIIEEANKRKAQKRKNEQKKFRLQKGIRLGVALTTASIIGLTALGVIKPLDFIFHDNSQTVVASEVSETSILDANDLLALRWADYAMGEVSEICSNTEYETVANMREIAYADYYVKVMSSYYDYLDYYDQMSSGIPEDLITDGMSRAHNNFRSNLLSFDEYLKNSVAFSNCTFSNSPFSDAIIIDDMGQVASSGVDGEIVDSTGNVITYDDGNYEVYVKGVDFGYNLDNLPDSSIIHDGEVYVDYANAKEYGTIKK